MWALQIKWAQYIKKSTSNTSTSNLSLLPFISHLLPMLTHLLNLTCPLRYWNKMRYCSRMCRRKLLSLSCKSINYSKNKHNREQHIKFKLCLKVQEMCLQKWKISTQKPCRELTVREPLPHKPQESVAKASFRILNQLRHEIYASR